MIFLQIHLVVGVLLMEEVGTRDDRPVVLMDLVNDVDQLIPVVLNVEVTESAHRVVVMVLLQDQLLGIFGLFPPYFVLLERILRAIL